jgi:hypothetical protein
MTPAERDLRRRLDALLLAIDASKIIDPFLVEHLDGVGEGLLRLSHTLVELAERQPLLIEHLQEQGKGLLRLSHTLADRQRELRAAVRWSDRPEFAR